MIYTNTKTYKLFNLNKRTKKLKSKPKPKCKFKNCSRACVHIILHNRCTQHSTEQLQQQQRYGTVVRQWWAELQLQELQQLLYAEPW